MKNKFLSMMLIGCISLGMMSCKKDKEDPDETGPKVPTTYNYDNVDISGQAVRLLLLMDLEAKIQTAATVNVTKAELKNLFEQNNEVLGKYTSLATGKNLKGKFLASSANSSIKQQWLDSIEVWFDTIEARSPQANAWVRADGVDLSQAIAKTIMGAVIYDQAVNHYLNVLTSADNSTVNPGVGTSMEHQFDEAFGYFGAARDYNSFTDAQLASATASNADGNGQTDTLTEMNFRYFSATAAKRDNAGLGTDFTKELFDAFLLGRFSISNIDYTNRDAAIATIKAKWEEVIAATVLHYINETKGDLPGPSTDLSKHWSEMRFYFNMISFYPNNKIGQTGIDEINELMGDKPSDTDDTKLSEAAEDIRAAYGFTTDQRDNW